MLITTPQNACPSPVCFAPSFTAHSSAATAIAFDPAFSLLNTFSTRTYALFVTPFVLPTMNDDARDVRTVSVVINARVALLEGEREVHAARPPKSTRESCNAGPALRGGYELHVAGVQLVTVV